MSILTLKWVDYIEAQIGFVLPTTQYGWLINAVEKAASELGLDIQTLYDSLDDDKVRQHVIDTVLISETRFFRNKAVVAFVADCYTNHLSQADDTPFVVASIGCSTGQEIWSLAMALAHKQKTHAMFCNNQTPAPFELIGVDASTKSLQTAKSARYSERLCGEIPEQYHHYWHKQDKVWQLDESLINKATFVHCNVFSHDDFLDKLSQYHGNISLVLCQNMLIYFRRFDQVDILDRLTGLVTHQGFLVLGAGEGWFWNSSQMKALNNREVNVWQKSTPANTKNQAHSTF